MAAVVAEAAEAAEAGCILNQQFFAYGMQNSRL